MLDLFERVLAHCGAGLDKRAMAHTYFAALNGILITFRNYPGRYGAEVRRHMEAIAGTMAEALERYGNEKGLNEASSLRRTAARR